ncbi:hypothetical protein GQ600_7520 [Phytophthora cactorum]|nr:hypothetical protein GQ600_7520 [Phytophthora cactorum]
MGLLLGLRACHRHNWYSLHVVGGSKRIIDQLSRKIAPRAVTLSVSLAMQTAC